MATTHTRSTVDIHCLFVCELGASRQELIQWNIRDAFNMFLTILIRSTYINEGNRWIMWCLLQCCMKFAH